MISFSPTDMKIASCSDDVTLKIWDFARCTTEHVLTGLLSCPFHFKVTDGM